jgi:hypothetical protein
MTPEERDRGADKRLNPQGAFVVQFVSGSNLEAGAVGGRVEHVATGRHARFYSIDELLRFLGEELARPAAEDID